MKYLNFSVLSAIRHPGFIELVVVGFARSSCKRTPQKKRSATLPGECGECTTTQNTMLGSAQNLKQKKNPVTKVSPRTPPPCRRRPTHRKLVWGCRLLSPLPRASSLCLGTSQPRHGGGGTVARLTALRRPPPPLRNSNFSASQQIVFANRALRNLARFARKSCKRFALKSRTRKDNSRETHQLFLRSDSTPFRPRGRPVVVKSFLWWPSARTSIPFRYTPENW